MRKKEKSVLLKIINTFMQKYGLKEKEILYYFDLSDMNYMHLKTGKITSYKLENLVECIDTLKKLNRNDLIREIIEVGLGVNLNEI